MKELQEKSCWTPVRTIGIHSCDFIFFFLQFFKTCEFANLFATIATLASRDCFFSDPESQNDCFFFLFFRYGDVREQHILNLQVRFPVFSSSSTSCDSQARQVSDKMPIRDGVLWTSLITGYSHMGNFQMPIRNAVFPFSSSLKGKKMSEKETEFFSSQVFGRVIFKVPPKWVSVRTKRNIIPVQNFHGKYLLQNHFLLMVTHPGEKSSYASQSFLNPSFVKAQMSTEH